MIWKYAKQVTSSFFKGVDKRILQQQIDVHRLFLLTAFHHRSEKGLDLNKLAKELSKTSLETSFEEQKNQVDFNVLQQVCSISRCLHTALLANGDPCEAAMRFLRAAEQQRQRQELLDSLLNEYAPGGRPQSRGLAIATGRRDDFDSLVSAPSLDGLLPTTSATLLAPASQEMEVQSTTDGMSTSSKASDSTDLLLHRQLGLDEVASAFRAKMGFSLHVQTSEQAARQAGNGLWLKGTARMGSVVALYPGLVYTPDNYRHIPGYPLIDKSNDYLMSRFDKAILDAKPWCEVQQELLGDTELPEAGGKQSAPEELLLQQLETRHPLAMAQYANHPSKGNEPNVMPAPFDFHAAQVEGGFCLRAYVPNASVKKTTKSEDDDTDDEQVELQEEVLGLALVATRPLADEEILMNYRLSTHLERPAWYHPVDNAEDERRWG